MREIKFRVWDELAKEIIPVKSIYFDEDDGNLMGVEAIGDDVIYFKEELEKRFSLMQYTGLKGFMSEKFNDSEEKCVYEGDYITIFNDRYAAGYYLEEYITGVVDLDETGTAFVIKNAKYESNSNSIPESVGDMKISVNTPTKEELETVHLFQFDLSSENITIHGNIYENPELLEDTK